MKKNFNWAVGSAIVMLLLPWAAVSFLPGDAGMAVCFLLFYAVNPVCSVAAGVSAGKNPKALWMRPVLPAVFFLAGAWTFFDLWEIAFVFYAGVYLTIGMISMLFSMLKRRS